MQPCALTMNVVQGVAVGCSGEPRERDSQNRVSKFIYIYTNSKRPENGICVDTAKCSFPPTPGSCCTELHGGTGGGVRAGYTDADPARLRAGRASIVASEEPRWASTFLGRAGTFE